MYKIIGLTGLLMISLSCMADGNDLQIEVDFSGMQGESHQGLNGILSVTVTNNGTTVNENQLVIADFVYALSAEDASIFFITFTENLDLSCGYDAYFHIDPPPGLYPFLRLTFPDIAPMESHTCQLRYFIVRPNLITTSWHLYEPNDPNPSNNQVLFTMSGFVYAVPVISFWAILLLMLFVWSMVYWHRKQCNGQSC